MRILSFGEILFDEYENGRCLGGAPLNFAAHIKRSGAESFLCSAVGDDEAGQAARGELARLGICDRFVATVKGKSTGKCMVSLDRNGVPTYELLRDVAYDHIPFDAELKGFTFDALAFGTLALREENNRKALQEILRAGICKTAYCDLNLRAPFYDRATVELCLRTANILKLSEEELSVLTGIFSISEGERGGQVCVLAEKFKNLQVIAVTLGERGAFAYERKTDRFAECGAVKAEVVSTVGAGDSFGAAFLAEYLSGGGVEACLKKGAERSAFVVAHKEAIPW